MRGSCSAVRRTWIMSISLACTCPRWPETVQLAAMLKGATRIPADLATLASQTAIQSGVRQPAGAVSARPPCKRSPWPEVRFTPALVISIVAVVGVTDPDSLPAPGGQSRTPARAAIETNSDAEWYRREGERAMTEPIEASERNPIEAWCN